MQQLRSIVEPIKRHLKRVANYRLDKVLSDPRYERHKKWSFRYLMEVTFAGMLCGCKHLRELETFSESMGERVPDTTLNNLLVQMDHQPLRKKLVREVKQALRSHELPREEFPIRLTAIDGKSISVADRCIDEDWSWRNRRNGRELYIHIMLRAFHVSNQEKLLLGQREVPGKTNESPVFRDFIDDLAQDYGRTNLLEVFSVDAGMTSIHNAQYLRDRDYHYIMALKDPKSKPVTRTAMEKLGKRSKPDKVEETLHSGNQVTYKLYRCRATFVKGWEHATEFWRVEKTTIPSKDKRQRVRENRYYATSVPVKKLSSANVLKAVKMHWGIENNSNWIMDTAWKEDGAPWANEALRFVSWMRMLAFNIVSRLKNRKLRNAEARNKSWKALISLIRDVYIREGCFNFYNMETISPFI